MFRKRSIIVIFSLCTLALFSKLWTSESSVQAGVVNKAHKSSRVFAPSGDVLLTIPPNPSNNKMIMQVSVPELKIEKTHLHNNKFDKISMIGYDLTSEAGKPQMPMKSFFLEVPKNASLQIKVVRSHSISRSNIKVSPAPTIEAQETETGVLQIREEYSIDGTLYSSDRNYPETLAEVGFYGYLRDVRVAQIKLFPVQFNPIRKEITHHIKIWLEVKIVGGIFSPVDITNDEIVNKCNPFDAIYKNIILNYSPGYPRSLNRFSGMWEEVSDLDYLSNDPYKIAIEEDGFYAIGYQDLIDAGVNVHSLDPKTIKIFNLGEEISISVIGEEDEIFDPGDYIEFFGLGNKGEYSSMNVYWLSWGGSNGARMDQADCSPGDSLSIPEYFIQQQHFEEDNRYYSNVYLGEGKDHWFWEQLNAPDQKVYRITLPNVSEGSLDARITLNLRGKNDVSHSVQAFLNGNLVAECNWSGMIEYENTFSFPQSFLNSGLNVLIIESSYADSQLFMNWVNVDYQRDYQANQGCLRFRDSESGPNQFEVHGFSDSSVELFRITDPVHVVRMTNSSIIPDGSDYKLVFEDDVNEKEYYALTLGCLKSPISITQYVHSHLHTPASGADYVIITHGDFYDQIGRLKELRENDGLRVTVVKIDDIYDEFSFGNTDPRAIRDFLKYTFFNWREPAPSYVLLVGDASYDYRGNISGSNTNYVPTHLFISQTTLEVSSDDWFVYLVGDDLLADMLIGRLSAQTASDLEAQIDKILGYEMNIPAGDWRENILLIADPTDEGGNFESICDNFANNYIVPAGYKVNRCNVRLCSPDCKQCILNNVNDGQVICNFIGHGSMDSWSKQLIFQSPDVSTLSNGSRQPFFVTMNCLNGYFHHATDDYCLAEELLRADNKGAVACLSHSGLDYAYLSEIIGCKLYEALLNDGNNILGSAVCQAKIGYLSVASYYWDQAVMLILFGDPALEMGFPGRPDVLPGDISFHPFRPVAGGVDTVTAVIFNAGREAATNISAQFSQGHPDSNGTRLIAEVTIPNIPAGGHTNAVAIWDSLPDAGIYDIYVSVDPNNLITESNEWNNTLWDTLSIQSPGEVQDTLSPIIELFVDNEKVGAEFHSNNYVSNNPEIKAVLKDTWSGIDTDRIYVTLNEEPVTDYELDIDVMGSPVVTLTYTPPSLKNGHYDLVVRTSDCAMDPNLASCSVAFVVESAFRLANVIIYPNPSRGSTSFAYSLTQNTEDVTIYIYSVTGRLLKTMKCGPRKRNTNIEIWDGRDLNGNRVASGIYLYKIKAKINGSQTESTGKIAVVR